MLPLNVDYCEVAIRSCLLTLLFFITLYVYLAYSSPVTALFLLLVSLIPFYLSASNIALNLVLGYTKP